MNARASMLLALGLLLCAAAPVLLTMTSGCHDLPASNAPPPEPATLPSGEDADHYVRCRNGVVVSVSAAASDVGRDVLRRGGNAVDAAVATAFALQSTYPLAGNIAGGGFMVIHPGPGRGEPVVIDYRECAPAAATPTMYDKAESQFHVRAVAVPGTVRGLEMAHRRFGTLPWPQLIRPAIALARDGYVVDDAVADSTNETLAAAPPADFPELHRVYGKPGGGPWKAGDRMVQPDLARALQWLADLGPDAFYTGPLADALLREITAGGGLITAADLATYRAIERRPLTIRYRGTYDVYVPPPPSSGGTCLLEELNMLEALDLGAAERWAPRTVHLMAEVMRRANCDRARYLGDPAFAPVPQRLLSPEYARGLARGIDPQRATPSASLAGDLSLSTEGPSTTHFSIVDRSGMAVANTYTLERRWGSRIVVKNMGFLLNNDMRAFNLFPGMTDAKGQVGTAPNTIAPGKRPISSMTPTIVARDGRVLLVTGSPGSRGIPHTVLGILVSVLDFGVPIHEAVQAPRFTQEWFPDQIGWERADFHPQTVQALRAMGHLVVPPAPLPFFGDAHTIWLEPRGTIVGVADHRISGKASGY
jgi:gamma-glutamyltranspeptidase/glutathione hydrolase